MKRSLGIDLGRNIGWAVCYDGDMYAKAHFQFVSLLHLYNMFRDLIELYEPDAIVNCRAIGRQYRVIRHHATLAGVIELLAEKKGIPYFDVPDNTIRKVVLSNGHAKKEEVQKALGIENEHEADAYAGAKYIHMLDFS